MSWLNSAAMNAGVPERIEPVIQSESEKEKQILYVNIYGI